LTTFTILTTGLTVALVFWGLTRARAIGAA
jgi:hypothetical protein